VVGKIEGRGEVGKTVSTSAHIVATIQQGIEDWQGSARRKFRVLRSLDDSMAMVPEVMPCSAACPPAYPLLPAKWDKRTGA
jgi:hypothetical protein